ncbi:unnamed protein product [Sphagnum jensenii]
MRIRYIVGESRAGICYDLRFAELALLMRQRGARLLLYPGSFNLTTGPLHWELLLRVRALDTQCYVAGVSTARNKEDTSVYQAWGHSTLVDPFGKVLVKLNDDPSIEYCDLNFDYLEEATGVAPGKEAGCCCWAADSSCSVVDLVQQFNSPQENQARELIDQIYARYDRDNSGWLGPNEFPAAYNEVLGLLGLDSIPPKQALLYLQEIEQSGKIERPEFYACVQRILNQ